MMKIASYLDWLVSVAGVVLGGKSDDETAPQSDSHTEEHVPVLDNPGWVSKDARELGWQSKPTDDEDGL